MKNNRRNKKNFNGVKGGDNQPVVVHDEFAHVEPVQAKPLEVKVYGNNFDKAFRAFRALVQKERVLSVYKEKQGYEKPSDKKRRKRNESIRKRIELCSKGDCNHSEHSQNRREKRNSE